MASGHENLQGATTPLGPNDVARRAFTPSADGYHQGEVREFLERIARQMRTMAAQGMPPAAAPVAATTAPPEAPSAAATSHVQGARLDAIEGRLDQLDQAVTRVLDAVESLRHTVAHPTPTAPAPSSLQRMAPTADTAPAPARAGAQATAATQSPPRSLGDAAAPRVEVERPAPTPTPATATPLPRVGSTPPATASMGDVTTTDPLIAESANDLLDGVLDDVMGRFSKSSD